MSSWCQTLKDDVIARHEALFKYAPCGIMLIDMTGSIVEINPKVLEILGSPSLEETKNVNMLDFPRLVEAGISDLVRRSLCGEKIVDEVPYISKWGRSVIIRFTAAPVLDDDGEVCFSLVIMEDMSSYYALKSELTVSNKLLNTVIDAIPSMIWMKDINGRYLHSNKSFDEFNGFVKGGIIGKTDHEVWSEQDADLFVEADQEAMQCNFPVEIIEKVQHPIYGERWYRTLKVGVCDEHNRTIGSVGISCDITKQHEQDEIIAEAVVALTNTLNNNELVR